MIQAIDETLTPSLLPIPPNKDPLNEIQMNNVPPSYKDITIGSMQNPISLLGVDSPSNDHSLETVGNSIKLTEEDKQRLYALWSHSVIIKAVKMKFNR